VPRSRIAPFVRASSLLVLLLVGCGATPHRFPLADPIWVDDDRRPFARRPPETYTPPQWDRADALLFRPMRDALRYELETEAQNFNALDEVPDSSWFTNRVGRHTITAAEVRAGACDSPDEPPRPWTVIRAKEGGSSPGLVIRDASGQISIFKIDFDAPERGTASDSIATRLFWAAGYFTPCNRVVFFTPEDLHLATEPDGDHRLPTQEDVDRLVAAAFALPDGRLRGSVSEYTPGPPLGGWRFEGTNEHDPNDVFDHQHRREVRGMYTISAWLNHIDSRAENNMDVWIEDEQGLGYLRHYVLDAGDSLGQIFDVSLLLSQSFGLSHHVDFGHMAEDFLTLGFVNRAWYDAPRGREAEVFGFFDVERFDPDDWRNGYPNPAFDQATERDRAWMARILARFTDAHLLAAIDAGRFSRASTRAELFRILRGRRRRVFERFLTKLSPLTYPEVDGATLCLDDLAIESGLRFDTHRRYRAEAWRDWPREGVEPVQARRVGTQVCLQVPLFEDASEQDPRYRVIDVWGRTIGHDGEGPARVHLYQTGPETLRVVGLERPDP